MNNELEMSMNYKDSELKGTLFFNMCAQTTINNICGKDISVTGKFIFVTKNPSISQPKCLIINSKDNEEWNYSMFKANHEDLKLKGIRITNFSPTLEVIDPGILNNAMDNVQKKIFNGLNYLDPDTSKKNKIQIDSIPNNLRILTKNEQTTNNFRSLTQNNQSRVLANNNDLAVPDIIDLFKMIFIKDFSVKINMYCQNEDQKIMSHYISNQKILEINVFSSDGCVKNFEILQALNSIGYVSGWIFLFFGFFLCYFGIQIYKEFFEEFVVIIMVIVGCILYVLSAEYQTTFLNKVLVCVGIFVFLFIVALIFLVFDWIIHFFIAFGVACQFGLFLHSILEKNITFFATPYTEWIFISILFILLLVMFFMSKDYFIIISHAIMGSLLIIISLNFMGFISYDLLFDVQINKFSEMHKFDDHVQNVGLIFLGLVVVSLIAQIIWFKVFYVPEKDEEEEEDTLQENQENELQQGQIKEPNNIYDNNVNVKLENI